MQATESTKPTEPTESTKPTEPRKTTGTETTAETATTETGTGTGTTETATATATTETTTETTTGTMDADKGFSNSGLSIYDSGDYVQYFGKYEFSDLSGIYGDDSDDIVATDQIVERLDSLVIFSTFNFIFLGLIVLYIICRIFVRFFKDVIYTSF